MILSTPRRAACLCSLSFPLWAFPLVLVLVFCAVFAGSSSGCGNSTCSTLCCSLLWGALPACQVKLKTSQTPNIWLEAPVFFPRRLCLRGSVLPAPFRVGCGAVGWMRVPPAGEAEVLLMSLLRCEGDRRPSAAVRP